MTQEMLLKLFRDDAVERQQILERKSNDYSDEDALSNFKTVAAITGVDPEIVALVLIGVKVARLGVLLSSGKEPANEPVKDTVVDLENYAFLLNAVLYDKG
jgi:hypothetical protein